MIVPLETPRLILRPIELADADQAQRLFPHWEIVKYLNGRVPWPYSGDGAFVFYRDNALPAMERGDAWHWSLRLKADPSRLIGAISLMKGQYNRGFWIGLPWQGQGLMTEAVEAANDYWFDVLRFPVLRAPKAVVNVASRRISEKTGTRMIEVTESDSVSGPLPTEIWEITAPEWHGHRRRQR
jgi:[ribosomal protein S5]-alanine N-acetyltransferase